MLDPGKPSFTPKKGKTSVVMFVGLQGNWCFRLLWYDLGSNKKVLFLYICIENVYVNIS